MKTRVSAYPELAEFRVGRRFRQRPADSIIEEFLRHVWKTGMPHTWRWITTTPHPKGEAPLILTKFGIEKRLRSGRETRAPCSICSPDAPKFDHGFLVFSSSDGHLRIIGHECGHAFFAGDSYAAALKEHEGEQAEALARAVLSSRMPDLSRTLLEAVTVARALREFLDFRERAFSALTHAAVGDLNRARVGDQLTVDVESTAKDEQGRHVIERQVVATLPSSCAGAFAPRSTLPQLLAAIQDASSAWIVESSQIREQLSALTRHDALASAKSVQRLDKALAGACGTLTDCRALFSPDGLRSMSAWGRHMQCPSPFWIEVVGRRVFLGRGLRPHTWLHGAPLTLPPENLYDPIVVS